MHYKLVEIDLSELTLDGLAALLKLANDYLGPQILRNLYAAQCQILDGLKQKLNDAAIRTQTLHGYLERIGQHVDRISILLK